MSILLSEVEYESCPFCQTNLKNTYSSSWNEYMLDIYESYDYAKGDKRYYNKDKRFIICAKCKNEIKFDDLKPKKP